MRDARQRGPLPWLLGLAFSAFLASLAVDKAIHVPEFCGSLAAAILVGEDSLLLELAPPTALAVAWSLMLVAMMPPLLVQPVRHVWISSFSERRARALALFALGYAAVWTLAGLVLVPVAVIGRVVLPAAGAGAILLALALAWSCSPAAQRARNRCHRTGRIGAFGWRADRDCIAYGLSVGGSCAGVCWPWMLASLSLERFHLIGMGAIAFVLLLERMGQPQMPTWQRPPALSVLVDIRRRQKVLGSR